MPHKGNHYGQNTYHNQWSNQQYSSQNQYSSTYPNQQFMPYENGGNLTYPDQYNQSYAQQGQSSTVHSRYPANTQSVAQTQSRQSHTYQTQPYPQVVSQHSQPHHSQTHHSNQSYDQSYRHSQSHPQPYPSRPRSQVIQSYAPPQATVIIPPSNQYAVPLSPDGPSQYEYPASPSRPFSCELCALSFNRQHDLKRHRETHTGEKPYNCNGGCGKTFTRKDALKRHQIVKGCGRVDEGWS